MTYDGYANASGKHALAGTSGDSVCQSHCLYMNTEYVTQSLPNSEGRMLVLLWSVKRQCCTTTTTSFITIITIVVIISTFMRCRRMRRMPQQWQWKLRILRQIERTGTRRRVDKLWQQHQLSLKQVQHLPDFSCHLHLACCVLNHVELLGKEFAAGAQPAVL